MNQAISRSSVVRLTCEPSKAARERMLSRLGEPLFVAGWHRVLMIHFEVDARALQRDVPFQLDLFEGRAFVSTVAFTMCGMRPRLGGRVSAWMFLPIATHDFLNVRTYVRHDGESGIHFLAEWLSSRLAAKLGPASFGLPYRYGRIDYHHDPNGVIQGQVADRGTGDKFSYQARCRVPEAVKPCEAGSHDEWLMERYTAFNSAGWRKRYFRVWHQPWPQCAVSVKLADAALLARRWQWFGDAQTIGANYSPGFEEVWMGRPHRVS
jgi:uncharacterized protein YqjF (DUF2071 family)